MVYVQIFAICDFAIYFGNSLHSNSMHTCRIGCRTIFHRLKVIVIVYNTSIAFLKYAAIDLTWLFLIKELIHASRKLVI